MDLSTIVADIHRLNHEIERFERKYGVMSETFYEAYRDGEEPADDACVLDFEKWAGLYEVWLDRRRVYTDEIQRLRAQHHSLSKTIRPVGV